MIKVKVRYTYLMDSLPTLYDELRGEFAIVCQSDISKILDRPKVNIIVSTKIWIGQIFSRVSTCG